MISAFLGHLLVMGHRAADPGARILAIPVTPPTAECVSPRKSPLRRATWSCAWVDGRPAWGVRFDADDAPTPGCRGEAP